MNPAELKFNIIPILVGAIGLIVAFWLGLSIGGSETSKLGLIAGSAVLIGVIGGMRQYVWLLVPMFWSFTGSIAILPLPFAVRDLVLVLVAALSFALLALRIFKFRNRWGLLDFLLLLNLTQIGLVFISNPVGLKSLSSQTVGARPYFNVAIAVVAYFILSNQVLARKIARRLPIFILIPEAISSMVALAVRVKPGLGYVLGMFYSGYLPQMTMERGTGVAIQRVAIGSGSTLITVLCSYFRPLTLLNPLRSVRFLLLVIGMVLILLSGFRSQLINVVAIFVLASYFRKGLPDVITVLAGMFLAVLVLILVNSVQPLPLAVQRTLSFLPGNWDSLAVSDATGSTEWRVQMWKDISKGSRYIRNKVMGDGFGFSAAELHAMERQQYAFGGLSQEDSMIIGSFHNGPLSTIRFVGVVGLILYYALLIYVAIYAWRLIRASEDTDFYPLALFVGLALIWEPLNYTFVFGGYDSSLPNTIFAIGMLKMVHNSLRSAQKTKSKMIAAPSPVARREPALL